MTDDNDDMTRLAPFFEAARQASPEPSAALLARIMADAETEMPAPPTRAVRRSLWQQISEAIGGWPAMGGLVAATAAGLWLGLSPPAVLHGVAGGVLSDDTASYWVDTSVELALGLSEEGI